MEVVVQASIPDPKCNSCYSLIMRLEDNLGIKMILLEENLGAKVILLEDNL